MGEDSDSSSSCDLCESLSDSSSLCDLCESDGIDSGICKTILTLIEESEEGPEGFEDFLTEELGGPEDSPTRDWFEELNKTVAAERAQYFFTNSGRLAEWWVNERVFLHSTDSLLLSEVQKLMISTFFDTITAAADQFPLFNNLGDLQVQDIDSLSEKEEQTIMDKMKPYCEKISNVLNENIKKGLEHFMEEEEEVYLHTPLYFLNGVFYLSPPGILVVEEERPKKRIKLN